MESKTPPVEGGRAKGFIILDLLRLVLAQTRTNHADPEISLTAERLRLDLAQLEKDNAKP